ncbi:hypothetical protein SK803_35990 [Lentzea sp. BCCO 10_0856]|uniref:Peptidase inhibitor family I36 n=1 Tax=Lentzea miocenica TaxID=3095431 RepID=A0ABU4TC86_9PSEU|nr:hypothetical protein [Lentzea sp. BCCO 10_0856]MDX8035634.1 hypothetical protein [Lentzea sp. BCCO 10_0856]
MITKEQGARSVRRAAGPTVALAFTVGALITGTTGAQAAPAAQAVACTNVGKVANTVDAFTLFDGTGRSGACITFWKYGNCSASTSDINGQFNLAAWGWDNRAGSVTTAHQCDVRLFDAADCPGGGLRSTWIDRSEDLRLGGVNWQNRATCVQIS